jgi:aspartyl protease family protein
MLCTMERFALGTLIVAALIGLLTRGDEQKSGPERPARAATSPVTAAPGSAVTGEVTLTRDAGGHFVADALVNGTPVRFLVDTGASVVALTRADAERVGLLFSDSEFSGVAQTAGGAVAVREFTLDSVALGNLNPGPVEAAIVDKGLSVSLLGQSWLTHMNSVAIERDKMVLR